MGQKVNPHGLRVGVINDWNTTWYADKKEFSKFLKEDNVIRTFLTKEILHGCGKQNPYRKSGVENRSNHLHGSPRRYYR